MLFRRQEHHSNCFSTMNTGKHLKKIDRCKNKLDLFFPEQRLSRKKTIKKRFLIITCNNKFHSLSHYVLLIIHVIPIIVNFIIPVSCLNTLRCTEYIVAILSVRHDKNKINTLKEMMFHFYCIIGSINGFYSNKVEL